MPIIAYHGSDANFDKFRSKKECGIHFALGETSQGRGAALHRIFQTIIYRADLKMDIMMQIPVEQVIKKALLTLRYMDPVIYQVSLNISSSLRMHESIRVGAGFAWDSSRFLNNLLDPLDALFIDQNISGVTEQEIDNYNKVIEDGEFLDIIPDEEPIDIYDSNEQEVCEYVGKFLAYKGFDSVIYENLVEGGEAIIVFDMDRITIEHKQILDEKFIIPHFIKFVSSGYNRQPGLFRNPFKYLEQMKEIVLSGNEYALGGSAWNIDFPTSEDLEDYYPETALGEYVPERQESLYHGRNVIWDGIEGHMVKVNAENIAPAFGNKMNPNKLIAIMKGIEESPDKLIFTAAWGEMSKINRTSIRESLEYANDFPDGVLTTGDEELDEFLLNPYQTIYDHYADPEDDPEEFCKAYQRLSNELDEAETNEEGDFGQWVFTLTDGHHRVFGALLAGEPYVWVMISGNQLQDALNKVDEDSAELSELLE